MAQTGSAFAPDIDLRLLLNSADAFIMPRRVAEHGDVRSHGQRVAGVGRQRLCLAGTGDAGCQWLFVHSQDVKDTAVCILHILAPNPSAAENDVITRRQPALLIGLPQPQVVTIRVHHLRRR